MKNYIYLHFVRFYMYTMFINLYKWLVFFLSPQQARVQKEMKIRSSKSMVFISFFHLKMIENKPNIRKPDKMEMNNVALSEMISVILFEQPCREETLWRKVKNAFTSMNKESVLLSHF